MSRRTTAVAGLSLMLIAACGSTSKQAATQAHPTPRPDAKQAVLASLQKTTGGSFMADMSISATFKATGPQAAQLHALEGQAIDFTMKMSAESKQRIELTVDTTVSGRPVKAEVVQYDGTLYVSSNGGTSYKVVPTTGGAANQYDSDNGLAYLQSVATVTDEGAGTADGVAVERYSAQLDGSKVIALIRGALASVPSSAMTKLYNSLTFKAGSLEVTIDHQGHVVTEHGPIDASMDLGAVSASLAGTHVDIHELLDGHFHDYGSAVTVSRPAVIASS